MTDKRDPNKDTDWQKVALEAMRRLDNAENRLQRSLSPWVRWGIIGAVTVFAVVGIFAGWSWIFGSGVEAAQESEKLHETIIRYVIAVAMALGTTAVSIPFLTMILDPFSCRREFLDLVRENKASDTGMAIFSIGTAIYAGAIFIATLAALSG